MKNFFELITESIGWLQIVASPFLIGIIIGALIYFPNPSSITFILGIIVAILGLFLGIMWANKAWKGKGTIWFMSRVMATPELDNLDSQNKSDENKDAREKNQTNSLSAKIDRSVSRFELNDEVIFKPSNLSLKNIQPESESQDMVHTLVNTITLKFRLENPKSLRQKQDNLQTFGREIYKLIESSEKFIVNGTKLPIYKIAFLRNAQTIP